MKVKFLVNCVANKKANFVGDIVDINGYDLAFLLKTGRVVKVEEEKIEDFVEKGLETESRELEIKKAVVRKKGK